MQTNLYKYSGIDPVSFWKFTPGETVMMISASIENQVFELDTRNKLEARLCAVVLRANGVMKGRNKPFEIDDFMPKDKDVPKSPEDLERMAMMATKRMGGVVIDK